MTKERTSNYADFVERVGNEGGFIAIEKPCRVKVDDDGRRTWRTVKAVMYKYDYEHRTEDGKGKATECNLVFIDSKFEAWDVDDYLDDEQVRCICEAAGINQ